MEARQVDAGRGWGWIVEAFELFKLNPLMWIVLLLIYLFIAVALTFVPIIGSLVFSLIAPVFVAGFMLACRALDNGEELLINHLFAGFKENTGQLITIGGIYLAGMIVIMAVVFASLASLGGDLSALSKGIPPDAETSKSLLLAILLGSLLVIPLIMAYWFAPALVALNNLSAVEAMKLSFSACLRNILPLFVYSVIAALLLLLAMLPFGLGLFIFGPIMIAVLYTSYKDIFNMQASDQAALTT